MLLHSTMAVALAVAALGAGDRDPVVNPATPVAATAGAETPVETRTPRADTRYCIVHKPTGSLLTRRVCRTRDQWIERDGFDPVATS
jgi:hypothetical protein